MSGGDRRRGARVAAGFATVLAVFFLGVANARAQGPLADALREDFARAQAAYPGLVEVRDEPVGVVVMGFDDDAMAGLLDELGRGQLTPPATSALRVLFGGLAQQSGVVAVRGRHLLEDAASAAASSGNAAVLRGMTELLAEVMEDAANPFSLLAQDLLAEKMRCGAASVGDDALVDEIARRVHPDRAFALAGTDGTVADRYGLHAEADLFTVIARDQAVVATGSFGTVAISRDAGASWVFPNTGTDEPLYAAAFDPTGAELWAVGRGGVVLRSSEDGDFARVPTPFDRHFFGVSVRARGEPLVVGDFGLQLTRANERWRCVPRGGDVILGRVVAAGRDAVLVGEFGTLERLPAGRPPGRRAKLTGVPDDVYLFDVWFDASGRVGIAVGLAGTVVRSTDGGATWGSIVSGLEADLFGVGGSGSRVVVVGESGTVAVSEDLGSSFVRRPGLVPPISLHDVALRDPDTGWAVGARGTILAIGPGGAPPRWLRGPGAVSDAPAAAAGGTP